MNYKYFVKLKKEGNFYSAYNDDAYVIAYIMKYKLVYINDDNVKIGFPINLLDEVIYYLDRNKISYIVFDKPNIVKDYKNNNSYLKFLKKDVFVESKLYKDEPNNYEGFFKVIFEDEDVIDEYIINKNINSNVEIVEKVFKNNIGDVVKLNSGIRFKIIDKKLTKK